MKKSLLRVGMVAVVVGMAAASVDASVFTETKSAQTAFAGVSAAELPAQAASFVTHQVAVKRTDAAVGAMKAAIIQNPSAAAAVLASIVKADPAAAPQVAAAASTALPKQRLEFARIAAKSAPAYAAQIASRLAQQDPSEAKLIAAVITETVPDVSASAVLAAVAPSPAPAERAQTAETSKSLSDIIVSVGGAPFNGGTVNGNIVSTGTTQENSNTTRNYAAP